MTPEQQDQIAEVKARAEGMQLRGHAPASIEFSLREMGYSEAAIRAAKEVA